MEKLFKTLDEQLEILKGKGLIIEDEEHAKEILLRENYFFINGYRVLLMNSVADKTFVVGATFRELYSIFLFDRSFRNILFKNLLIIENQLKSVMSYQLSKKYGYRDKDYLNPRNFTNDRTKTRRVKDVLDKMKRQVRVNGSHHMATMHYMNNYGYIPLWVLVKVLSFGIVGEMYSILKSEDQREIAKVYGIDVDDFIVYLPILANYRNLCAHEDILYENKTQKEIDDTIYHKILNLRKEDNEFIQGKNDLFALIIIMKQMLQKEDFKNMVLEIDNVIQTLNYNITTIKLESVLDRMGFPKNWKDITNIERSVDN
jgi:abortive infection bacteriophage resistance protein